MPFLTDTFTIRSRRAHDFLLVDDLTYQGRTDTFTVPAGTRTDFATVPAAVTWLVPRYGVYTRAAILHDHLCIEAHASRFDRRDADGVFRRVLRELGVSHPRRWLMWAAVRVGGGFAGGMTPVEWVQFTVTAALGIVFLAVPVTVVAAWSALFWVLERPFTAGRG